MTSSWANKRTRARIEKGNPSLRQLEGLREEKAQILLRLKLRPFLFNALLQSFDNVMAGSFAIRQSKNDSGAVLRRRK
jgi:hypothetical protein